MQKLINSKIEDPTNFRIEKKNYKKAEKGKNKNSYN